jgi:threonine dehydrogenase-like Zn-dependent dehydrogenase
MQLSCRFMFLPKCQQCSNSHLQVAVEDRPYPNIQKPTDAILKVSSTALCGSDLHFYRGHLKCPPDFICGHEFVGEIVEKGDDVKKFNIGDKVCELQGGEARSAER